MCNPQKLNELFNANRTPFTPPELAFVFQIYMYNGNKGKHIQMMHTIRGKYNTTLGR